jgi:hypothetical protein
METCIVLISSAYNNARKVCEAIENQKFDSRESARETINKELDEDDAFDDVSIFRLSDFMEEVNDQYFDNLTEYFISYIHINLELSK